MGTLEKPRRQGRCFSVTPELFSSMTAGAPWKTLSLGVATGAGKKKKKKASVSCSSTSQNTQLTTSSLMIHVQWLGAYQITPDHAR